MRLAIEIGRSACVCLVALGFGSGFAHADTPVVEDYYPLGSLCAVDQSVALSDPGCIFKQARQRWQCHPGVDRCPRPKNPPYARLSNISQKYKMSEGRHVYDVSFLNETCPTIYNNPTSDHNANVGMLIGACDCALWFVRYADCGEGGCSHPILSKVTKSTKTIVDVSRFSIKYPATGFYCDEKTRTAYLLTGDDGGDEGPPGPEGDGIFSFHAGGGDVERVYSHANGLLDDNARDMLIQGNDLWVVTLTGVQRMNLKTHLWSYWKVQNGRMIADAKAVAAPQAEGFVLAKLKAGDKVPIVGNLEFIVDRVCIRLPATATGWVKQSELDIRGPDQDKDLGLPKYSIRGDINTEPRANATTEKSWWPSCSHWNPVVPLEFSPDHGWIMVSNDFGLVDRTVIEPELEPYTRLKSP